MIDAKLTADLILLNISATDQLVVHQKAASSTRITVLLLE